MATEVKQMDEKLLRIVIPKYPYPNVFSHLVMPPLGPFYVGASVRNALGWDVEIVDENNFKGPLNHASLQKARKASVVGFYGGLTSCIPRVYELAKFYRSTGAVTIAGGCHVDAIPEEALRNDIQIAVTGEGELTTPAVISAIEEGRETVGIAGTAQLVDGEMVLVRSKPIEDLGALPFPDFSMLVNQRRPLSVIPVSHTRGCIYRCEFCAVNRFLGPPRMAPIPYTLAHFENLLGMGYRNFFFTDDNFVCDREVALSLCRGISELLRKGRTRAKIAVQVRAEIADDDELLSAMRSAGINLLAIGLESPLPEDLKAMRKGLKADAMKERIHKLRNAGFYIHGMFIFGYPVEEALPGVLPSFKRQARIFMNFIREARIDTIQVLKAVPIPGTKLFKRLKLSGSLIPLERIGWENYDGNFLTFIPRFGSITELQDSATRIMRKFYGKANMLKLGLALFLAPVLLAIKSAVEWCRLFGGDLVQAVRERKFRALAQIPLKGARNLKEALLVALCSYQRSVRNYFLRTIGGLTVDRWLSAVRRTKVLDTLKKLELELRGRKLRQNG